MERSTFILATLMCVLIFRISGTEVEIRVRRGDDITIYCGHSQKSSLEKVWFRNSCNEQKPQAVMREEDLKGGAFPRYSAVWNSSSRTHDLLVKNVTESDLGLYYCARQDKDVSKVESGVSHEDVYHYGNRITCLSLLGKNTPQAPPPPPVSDCSVCWKLLVSVCPVCVLLSSLISSTCVYCTCRTRNKAIPADGGGRERKEVGGEDVCYAALDLPSGGQKRQKKKKRVESSDLCTYSEVKVGNL